MIHFPIYLLGRQPAVKVPSINESTKRSTVVGGSPIDESLEEMSSSLEDRHSAIRPPEGTNAIIYDDRALVPS